MSQNFERMPAVAIKEIVEVAERTAAFFLERPESFAFEAGQYMDVTLPEPPEEAPADDSRTFTIASAPSETGLMFATRLRTSGFKKKLMTLSPGDKLRINGPSGSFVLRPPRRDATVFVCGGIGVTPFRSILLERLPKEPSRRFVLLYSNRRPRDAAFVEELLALEKRHSNFRFVQTMTQVAESSREWQGLTGHISEKTLRHAVGSPENADYYVAGPPGMVEAVVSLLEQSGVSAGSVYREDFSGY